MDWLPYRRREIARTYRQLYCRQAQESRGIQMSLTSLASSALLQKEQRQVRMLNRPKVFEYTSQKLAPKYELVLDNFPGLVDDLLPLTTDELDKDTKASNVLDALTKYIPTES